VSNSHKLMTAITFLFPSNCHGDFSVCNLINMYHCCNAIPLECFFCLPILSVLVEFLQEHLLSLHV
jgi:hypothetical protein